MGHIGVVATLKKDKQRLVSWGCLRSLVGVILIFILFYHDGRIIELWINWAMWFSVNVFKLPP